MRLKGLVIAFGLFTFLFQGILLGNSPAQEMKKTYTMQESIEEALAQNWTLKAKEEKIDQATFIKNQARADFLPKFSTTYGFTRFRDDTMNFGRIVIPISQRTYEWSTTLSLPVFSGFAVISSYELGKLGIDQSEMEVDLEKLNLALRVKQAYFNILIADKAVEVAEKDVESRKSNEEVARSFYNVGMIPINDLLQAEVELANAQQDLAKVQNTSRLARSTFNIILTRPVNAPVDVEDILGYKPEARDFDNYLKRALEERPEIKLIDIGILQADQQIRLAKSRYYPEVAFVAEYTKQGDSPDVSGSPFHDPSQLTAMATLSWTFWNWGKTSNSEKEQESLKRQLMKEKLAMENEITLEVKSAVLDLETAEKNIPTTQKAVEQGEENLRVSEERYKAQVTTITEVLDAQTRLTQSRVNYFRALYDHNLAKARLLRAIGEY